MFKLFDTEQESYPPILPLESQLMETAGTPGLLQGLLYILPLLYQGKLFVRYITSGSYASLLPQILDILKKRTGIQERNIFPWQVYTPKDLFLHGQKTGAKSDPSTTFNRKVGSQNSMRMNKKSVLGLLNGLKNKLDETYALLFIHKSKASPANPTHRLDIPKFSQTTQ